MENTQDNPLFQMYLDLLDEYVDLLATVQAQAK